jgi:hypothetical protein
MDTAYASSDASTNKCEDWLSRYASDAEAIHSFFSRHGDCRDLLRTAIDQVERLFCPTPRLVVKVRKDPEYDDEWLLIEAAVPGTVDQALDAYRQFVKEWVKTAPASWRSRIRLAYRIQ